METEEIIELSLIAVIVVVLGYVIVKALGFLGDSGVPQGIGSVLSDATAPVTSAESTLLGNFSSGTVDPQKVGDTSSISNSQLFYTAINPFNWFGGSN